MWWGGKSAFLNQNCLFFPYVQEVFLLKPPPNASFPCLWLNTVKFYIIKSESHINSLTCIQDFTRRSNRPLTTWSQFAFNIGTFSHPPPSNPNIRLWFSFVFALCTCTHKMTDASYWYHVNAIEYLNSEGWLLNFICEYESFITHRHHKCLQSLSH